MADRAITEKQYRRLMCLGDAAMVVAPSRSEWSSLLRRGWVVAEVEDDKAKRYLPPLRITAEGFRALAEGVERYGLPGMSPHRTRVQHDEHPRMAEIKARLEESRQQLRESQIERRRIEATLARTRRVLEEAA